MAAKREEWTERAFRRAFGAVLRELRQERQWSQERLADAADYHLNHISYLERGLRSPTLIAVFHLAAALELSPLELVARVERALQAADESAPPT